MDSQIGPSRRRRVGTHEFETHPNRVLFRLALPVLGSLIAEPITGLVDTAFVAGLGSDALAGLGAGTIALSSVFWIFNFLGIGTQTETAVADGSGDPARVQAVAVLAIRLGLAVGAGVLVVGVLASEAIASLMGATGTIGDHAVSYMQMRWAGAPAMLVLLGVFGSMRGLQDMRTPLQIAIGINIINIALDAALISGFGAIPAMGVAGAGLASSISQWIGALYALWIVHRRTGLKGKPAPWKGLFRVGGDLFIRTGMLTLFLILATRAATRLGADSGAAHQAIRQVWIFTALFLDAWAVSAQSLVGYFFGKSETPLARQVAAYACGWSVVTGVLLALVLAAATSPIVATLVPQEARAVFFGAWFLALLSLPISAVTFATDGVHWGTADFAYLRKATTMAVVVGGLMLIVLEDQGGLTLHAIWAVTFLWVGIRAAVGLLRVWPGIGNAPLAAGKRP